MPQSGSGAPALVLHPPLALAPTWRRKKSPSKRKMCNIKSWATCLRDSCGCVSFPRSLPKKTTLCCLLVCSFSFSVSLSVSYTHMPKFVAYEYIAAFIARKVNGPHTGSVSTKWRLSDSFSYFPNFRFPLSCFLQIMNYSLFLSFLCSPTFHTSFPNHLSSSILMFPLVSRHPK